MTLNSARPTYNSSPSTSAHRGDNQPLHSLRIHSSISHSQQLLFRFCFLLSALCYLLSALCYLLSVLLLINSCPMASNENSEAKAQVQLRDFKNIFSLDGQIAVVTGGSRGLGLHAASG